MIDPVTGWFEIAQHDDKKEISIANLVETIWMYRYPIPIEITYEQGYFFSFFFWSGLQGPKAYSLWGGVVPSPSIG